MALNLKTLAAKVAKLEEKLGPPDFEVAVHINEQPPDRFSMRIVIGGHDFLVGELTGDMWTSIGPHCNRGSVARSAPVGAPSVPPLLETVPESTGSGKPQQLSDADEALLAINRSAHAH